ncbi:dihydrolipoyl dehydrogenase [Schinkia azotoformans]|uniref:Dihydrolipoyl dehydrogenase n=1 Tax=Schinkia azotoformans LMG 9581 TaxID=1131731 RepID=K6D528_SCHAZ|nr:dihydrolipoyl dehydrogenase [Schinkia azotoformans]EKN63148.1 dihydrolipoamide dehydrogenase [Schinkia azotoformans LMG 9581]MEC1640511.1 dihydrolipoyl dehydrogenase [Schinkia azotoformans]MEC1723057.1 dihydrolipoyl dehydrogenase [Schinkia azotoformans]MEC1944604.1 dihydrolipoyl dehydrogenase [Schinkia azotoformans]MED4414749.1 dihydrolipoyl dehydrogenase [Schinkia azotoformans]
MATEYDLVILGGGTGGYVAAIRAAQLGLKTAIVEKGKLGGTCLHQGCIPSKALLRSAEVYATAKRGEEFGVILSDVKLDFLKVQERKQKIIDQLVRGIEHLMKKGKIDIYEGIGRILGPSIFSPTPGTISVEMKSGAENEMLIPKNVIIATGSRPRSLPGLEIDGKYVMTSDEALAMENLPSSIIIVGGGVIGIEWASMLSDFGVDVTVIEYADRIIPTEDHEISKEMQRIMKKKKIKIVTGAKVLPETLVKENGVTIAAEIKGEQKTFSADTMLVSVGRQANVEDIGLQNTSIEVEKGAICTNPFYQTKESHIYAIGDVIGGLQLAHVASHEGIVAVEHLTGEKPSPIDYSLISKCIYSNPEVASVGYTEDEAKTKGYNVKIGKFMFKAIGKALVFGESDGFVKLVADRDTDDLLGVHMIGPHVTDMISEAGLARVLDATPWEIAHTIHPHPTLSEAIGEAALAVDGKAIHG